MRTCGWQLSRPWFWRLCTACCAGLVAWAPAAPAAVQSVWELTPYRIHVLVAVAPAAELTPRQRADLPAYLVTRADAMVGAPWNVTAAPAPPAVQRAMIYARESVTLQSLKEEAREMVVAIQTAVEEARDEYEAAASEFDYQGTHQDRYDECEEYHSALDSFHSELDEPETVADLIDKCQELPDLDDYYMQC